MVFILYKVHHDDNNICFTGVYECEEDAIIQQKMLTQDKTPEESLEESFFIKEVIYTKKSSDEPPMKYTEEDNSEDEYYVPYRKIKEFNTNLFDIIQLNHRQMNDSFDSLIHLQFIFILLVAILYFYK